MYVKLDQTRIELKIIMEVFQSQKQCNYLKAKLLNVHTQLVKEASLSVMGNCPKASKGIPLHRLNIILKNLT